jgi:hypothetical protein
LSPNDTRKRRVEDVRCVRAPSCGLSGTSGMWVAPVADGALFLLPLESDRREEVCDCELLRFSTASAAAVCEPSTDTVAVVHALPIVLLIPMPLQSNTTHNSLSSGVISQPCAGHSGALHTVARAVVAAKSTLAGPSTRVASVATLNWMPHRPHWELVGLRRRMARGLYR